MRLVNGKDLKNPENVGKVLIMFNTEPFVGTVHRIDDTHIYFTQNGGSDDGKDFRVPYDPDVEDIKVFEPEEEVLALMEI